MRKVLHERKNYNWSPSTFCENSRYSKVFNPLARKLFDQKLNFDLPQQKIYDKTKSVENNLVKIYIF